MEKKLNFKDGLWSKEINVSDFVHENITPYEGDASFLVGPTERTKKVWAECVKALAEERANNGVRALDNKTVSTISSHKAGYIDRENELIVGLQTDAPLKRGVNPFGGMRMVNSSLEAYNLTLNPNYNRAFTEFRKTHNDPLLVETITSIPCLPQKARLP